MAWRGFGSGAGTDLFDETALTVGAGDGALDREVHETGAAVAPIRRRSWLRFQIHVFDSRERNKGDSVCEKGKRGEREFKRE